jgi:hypothetical protein
MEIARTVQVAMLGEVPPTLRFLYVSLKEKQLNFHAVFAAEAKEEHLEAARCVSTEVLAGCPHDTILNETIEIDGQRHWRIEDGNDLMYLRFGELSNA